MSENTIQTESNGINDENDALRSALDRLAKVLAGRLVEQIADRFMGEYIAEAQGTTASSGSASERKVFGADDISARAGIANTVTATYLNQNTKRNDHP